ncbi:hypothetical protein SH139x_003825 [Planctomycetaceae bacterium SH139]
MRWRLMLSVLTYGAFVSAINLLGAPGGMPACSAQEGAALQIAAADAAPQQAAGQAAELPPSLLQESRAAKFRMILGRLSLEPPKHIKCSRTQESADGLVKESLRVTACRGIPSLHYHWATPTQAVSVDVHLATHVKLRSTIAIDDTPLTLVVDQPPAGEVLFRLESLDDRGEIRIDEQFSSPSLVHFRARYPREYERHLAPLLTQLLIDPQVECRADDLLKIAGQQPGQAEGLEAARIDQLIDQLRAPRRDKRAAAAQQLRAIGLPALAIIEQLDLSRFEPEQRGRLEQLQEQLRPHREDTPAGLARWLATDVRYWNLVAHQLSPLQLEHANQLLLARTGQQLSAQLRIAEGAASTRR